MSSWEERPPEGHEEAAPKPRLPTEPKPRLPTEPKPRLPTEAKARKAVPLVAGCIDYFPDALAAVAALSVAGNEQHNPGKPLAWDRSKSGDEVECLTRHLIDRGTYDTDGFLHDVKVAWRGLANLQKTLERLHGLPISRGSVDRR